MNSISSKNSTQLSILPTLASHNGLIRGWLKVAHNSGCSGGDGITVAQFSANADSELARLGHELASGLYRPGPIRVVRIPKTGGTRRLSIPCVRDRIVQSALAEKLDHLAEHIFEPVSYAYRKGRGVAQAVAAVERYRNEGFRHVVEADIEKFFDRVPHVKMIEVFRSFVPEADIVDLVTMWLDAADWGEQRGLPQGSPISPLLANMYLDSLDEHFERGGLRMVRFADDFVILCKSEKQAEAALADAASFLSTLGLSLNPDKTRIVSFDEGFRFLGHLFVRDIAMKSALREEIGAVKLPFATPRETELTPHTKATPGDVWPARPQPQPIMQHDASDVGEIPATDSQRSPVIRTLYIREPGRRLDLRNEAFVVSEAGTELLAAMPNWLDRIELGHDVEVSSQAIRQALAHEIAIVFVTAGERALGCLTAQPDRHGKRHLSQAAAVLDLDRARDYARAFVEGRLANEKALLYRLNRRRKNNEVATAAHRIGRLARRLTIAESTDELRGIEGEAASLYWPALGLTLEYGFKLVTRDRREHTNPVSVVLDMLAYLLTRDVETLVLRHGLHPSFGFLHASRDTEGAPAAYDLVEIFRAPLAEGLAVYLFNNRILSSDHFGKSEDGQYRMYPVARDRLIRTYEAWMNRTVKDPEGGGVVTWRKLISDEVRRFCRSLEAKTVFVPYQMGY